MFFPFSLAHTRTRTRVFIVTPREDSAAASNTHTHAPMRDWGWLPLVCCIEAAGLLTVALADNANRASDPWGETLFWIGLVILFLPVAIRLLATTPSRAERLGLVTLLGMSLYVVKLLAYPLMFTFFDELLHVRTAQDLLAHGSLFSFNSLLPISPLYPGLEIVTTTLSQLTGLTTFTAGVLVIGAARLLLLLALYLFFEGVSRSARLASIATLLYMTNPHFIFFDAQFAYESLAIGLGAFVLCLVIERLRSGSGLQATFTFAIWLALGALTITHHLTSYAIVALLLLWSAIFLAQRARALARARRGQTRDAAVIGRGPLDSAIVGALLIGGWALFTGGIVLNYVTPYLTHSAIEFSQIFAGAAPSRSLFTDYAGQAEPLWQQIVAFASVALITLGLPLGLWRLWRSQRNNAAALALGLSSLLYPISQVYRLTLSGSPIADRLPDYLFIGVGYTLALAVSAPIVTKVIHAWARLPGSGSRPSAPGARSRALVVESITLQVVLLVVFIGGVVVGAGQNWTRMPGPYLVEADMRSINSESIVAAQWALAHLGPGNIFATDRDNRLTLATYGDQAIVTGLGGHYDVASLFTSTTFSASDLLLLRNAHIRYLLVDLRLTTSLPHLGYYFEQNEPQAFAHTTPLNYVALTKFGAVPGVNCIYDSGDILIYDMGAYTNAY